MAEKRIQRDDVASKDVFKNIEEGAVQAEKTVKTLEKTLKAIKKLADEIKKGLPNAGAPLGGGGGGGRKPRIKDVEELNRLTRAANKTGVEILIVKRVRQLQTENKFQFFNVELLHGSRY